MRKISLALCVALLMLLSNTAYTQNSSFNIFEHSFDDDALSSEMMDSSGYHSSLIWDRSYVEYVVTDAAGAQKFLLLHTLRQINDIRAVEEFNKIYIPFYGDNVPTTIDSRVIVNGKVVFTGDTKTCSKVEEESTTYLLMALEGVTPGCFIETIVVLPTSFELVGSNDLQNSVPTKESVICIVSPEVFHFKYKLYNSTATVNEKVEEGRRFIYSIGTNLPALEEEEYCHNDARAQRFEHTLDRIDNTNFQGQLWADRGITFFDNNMKAYDDSKSGIKKLIKQLGLEAMKTEDEKIFALEDYLKRNISIDPNAESKADASDILKTKISNNFGFNRLFFLTLYELKIPVELTVTCSRENRKFDKDFASDYGFTDVLFYFPNSKTYLDPNNTVVRHPVISTSFLSQDAVRIRLVDLSGAISGVSSIKNIGINPIEKSVLKEEFGLKFINGNQETVESYKKSYTGFADQGIRSLCYFADEDQKKEFLENYIKGNFDNSKVENIETINYNLSSKEEYNSPFTITATITGADMLEFAGNKILLKIGEIIGQQSELYSDKPRQKGIDVEFAHYYDRTITVEIPEGFKLGGLDAIKKDVKVLDNDGKPMAFFTSDYKLEGGKLIITIIESYNALELPIEKYNDFREVINAASDFNKITLVLDKI